MRAVLVALTFVVCTATAQEPGGPAPRAAGVRDFDFLVGDWHVHHRRLKARLPGAYRGVSVRSFDAKTGLWAIWWLDGRDPLRALDPPLKGRFENAGTFYADDTFNDRPIRVRYVWSRITPTSAHWEQAFSPDGGQTWGNELDQRFQQENRS